MKTIAFVFDGLGFGGIERIGIDYVKMLTDVGYSVDVYNLNPDANDFVKNLPVSVRYYAYKLSRIGCPETYSYGVQKWWWGKYAYVIASPVLTLKQKIEKLFFHKRQYDVAIAISGHINDLSFVCNRYIRAKKKICWCHGNLISYLAICDAYPILYKKIDVIVTLSSAAEKDVYPGKKFLYDKRIVKIYNPTYIFEKKIDLVKVEKLKSDYADFFLMIARAEFRKGYDIAIKVTKRLREMGIKKYLLIAGDGELLEEYKKMAVNEGVDDTVVFLGNCSDIQNYIYASHIDILTSRWEGLPTVIIEAMTFCKPCVMTNTDDGEVSNNGEYCILKQIDDVDGIAEGLYRLYTDEAFYAKYAKLSAIRSKCFMPEVIREQVLKIL